MVSLYLWYSNNDHWSYNQCINTRKSFGRQLWMYSNRTNYNSNLAHILNTNITNIKHCYTCKWHDHMCRF